MNRLICIFHITIQCRHIFMSDTMNQSANLKPNKRAGKITQLDKKSIFGTTMLLKTLSPKMVNVLPDDILLSRIDLAQMMHPSLIQEVFPKVQALASLYFLELTLEQKH